MSQSFSMPDFALAAPEIFVLIMGCVLLVFDVFINDRMRILSYALAQLTIIGAALVTFLGFPTEAVHTFNGTYVSDGLGSLLKLFIYLVTGFVFLYSRDYLKERNLFRGEYYVLGLFGMLGMMIMVSAHSFLTIYLGLELLSLSLYAMVAFNRTSMAASESAMKYFVLGAIASGMLLYGMSMIYGATGTLDIRNVAAVMSSYDGSILVPVFGVVFIVIGLAFKLGAVPFHMWVPDVYHGSPTSVTLYIGSAPKIAGFAMFIRLLVEGLGALHTDWQQMLIVLSVLSLGIGNLIAIAQTNIKRMLAYSTISHVGFILLGLIAGTSDGYAASNFYVITYALTSMGAFAMIILLSRSGFEAENIDDFRGLNARHPWYAFLMLLLMFSMAGVPPTVGFYAKLLVLKAVIDIDLVWLAIVAVLFSVIGAFYYLRVIKVMYFDAPEEESTPVCSTDMHLALSINGLAMLMLGLFPGSLVALCSSVF
jgi:NADH-quinone oxidoreductase subunit N